MFILPSLKKSGHLDQIHMTVGIVGSRKVPGEDYVNQGWDLFAPNLTIYGFEADAEACSQMNAELEARNIDWTEEHIPLALGKESGKATLYITNLPQCSSLYMPDESYIKRFSLHSEYLKLVSTIEIDVTTLDEFCQSKNIQKIDFLQIDVQGAEIQVIEGASNLLKRSVLGMLLEVEFFSIYKNQPLFSDVDLYMRKQGFSLFDLGIIHRDRRRSSPIFSEEHPGQLAWSDAFYFRDLLESDRNLHLQKPEQILKLACIADILNFPDYALELLEYLTLNYGEDEKFNFADNIIESLAEIPELAEIDLASLPIIANILDYTSIFNLRK